MDIKDLQMPQALDAEKGLLGSILLGSLLRDELLQKPDDIFWHPAHREVFVTIREMVAANKPVDLISVTQELEDRGRLQTVGGAAGITELFTFVPTAANASYYAQILWEKWVLRLMRQISADVFDLSTDQEANVEAQLGRVEELLLNLRKRTENNRKDPVQPCHQAVMDALDQLELVYEKRGKTVGLATGIFDLDRMTSGLQGPRMYVFGGLPGAGKTALALQIAEHVSLDLNVPTLCFTQEMSSMELMVRALCRRSEIDLQRVRDGFMGRHDISNLVQQADRLSKSRLFLDETPGLTTAQFRARARAAKLRYGIGLIVIDYLQLMVGVSKAAKDNRQQEITEISGTIKAVCKELNIPIIVLAQLKRDAEHRKSAPKLADLRESGSIGQDADLVGLLQSDAADDEQEMNDGDDVTLHIVKQRQGPIGPIKLRFIKKYTRFENVTEKFVSNNQEKRQK